MREKDKGGYPSMVNSKINTKKNKLSSRITPASKLNNVFY
jgi:hypothetical protein